ncbi:choline transporter-like protein 2 isoform X1 [Lates japonicus]
MELEEKNPDPKYGESRKFDPNFKGPIHNRGCTDILCCILFILALLGYFAVGILAWSQGDPRKVIYPTDSRGAVLWTSWNTSGEEASPVLLQHIEMCQSSGAAGVSVSHHTVMCGTLS